MSEFSQVRKGRGASSNRDGRYESNCREAVDDGWGSLDQALPGLPTTVMLDSSRSVINYNQSPDIPFDRSINPYRGCEHGCIYCFARPTHAYLGLSPGLDFETRILVKPDAAAVLQDELRKPGYRCQPIAMGTNTDPYQPLERDRRITRSILEVLAACRHPVSLVTKSALIERDLDILAPMAAQGLVQVGISVTTLDRDLSRHLEPRAAAPQRRLATIARLAEAGVSVGVMAAPMVPALNDAELENILEAAAEAGAQWGAYILLRLPLEVKELFEEWLEAHAPLKAQHVMSLVRQSRGGKDYDPRFGVRMRGTGIFAEMINQRYHTACKRLGLNQTRFKLDCSRFTPPQKAGDQLNLF